MSEFVNIPTSNKDSHYRYKMPKIAVVSQGQGGNVKTKFENILDVAKALRVPPDCKI